MNAQLLPASAAALCAVILLVIMRHFIRTPSSSPIEDSKQPQDKSIPVSISPSAVSTPGSDVEKGETPPPATSYFSDVKIKPELVDEVWPPVERETAEPAPTLGGSLPDVALVWGMDYRPAVDRRPLMAYSTIASALGVEDEPVQSPPPSAAADTRPMVSYGRAFTLGSDVDFWIQRSGSLISGIASDWRSLSQSEQQAWATLSEARASRSRGTHNVSRELFLNFTPLYAHHIPQTVTNTRIRFVVPCLCFYLFRFGFYLSLRGRPIPWYVG
jgi:hypothetical protein